MKQKRGFVILVILSHLVKEDVRDANFNKWQIFKVKVKEMNLWIGHGSQLHCSTIGHGFQWSRGKKQFPTEVEPIQAF